MKTVLLIDGTNIFIRNYAVFPYLSSNGNRVGGIYGTLTSLGYFVRITEPDIVVFVWDGPGGSKRKKGVISYYKDGRKPVRLNKNFAFEDEDAEENKKFQQQRLSQYLSDLPLFQIRIEDIEADDVIGYLVNYYSSDRVIIASSDKDFYQLLGERTVIFTPTKKQFLTSKTVQEEFNIHPKNFALARAIIGDKSDNLVGIKGIGFKNLLKYFPIFTGNEELECDTIIEHSKSEGDKYKKFLEGEDLIRKNYEVMQLKNPLMSSSSINKVNDCLKDELHFNRTALRVKLAEDGIQQLGDSFFRNFKLLEIKGKDGS